MVTMLNLSALRLASCYVAAMDDGLPPVLNKLLPNLSQALEGSH
jgi:hypothetical protein